MSIKKGCRTRSDQTRSKTTYTTDLLYYYFIPLRSRTIFILLKYDKLTIF